MKVQIPLDEDIFVFLFEESFSRLKKRVSECVCVCVRERQIERARERDVYNL